MTRVRLTVLTLPILLVIAFGAARTAQVPTASAQSVSVSMIDNVFNPVSITVPAGTTVVWSNDDSVSGETHDVITEDGSFFSPILAPGETTNFTFATPGTYSYYCDLHFGMYGTVIVQ